MKNSYHKRLRGFLALALMLVVGASSALAQWTALPDLNAPRYFHTAAIANAGNNDRLYTFGGFGTPPGGQQETYLSTGQYLGLNGGKQWNSTAAMPNSMFAGYAGTVNNKIYVMGGLEKIVQTQQGQQYTFNVGVQEYDPVTNTFTAKAQMQAQQAYFSGVTVGDKIYVIGGIGVSGTSLTLTAATWVYDATQDTWTKINDAPTPGQYMAAAADGNTIYLIGGTVPPGNTVESAASTKAYKGIISGNNITWTPIADVPIGLTAASATVLDGKVYVAGGRTVQGSSYVPVAKMWLYDPASDTWEMSYPLSVETYYASNMVSDGSALYFVGGVGSQKVFKFVPPATPTPIADLATKEIVIGLKPGQQKSVSTSLRNLGIQQLTGTLEIPADAKSWLSASVSKINLQTEAKQTVNFTANAANLSVGVYSAQVMVNTNDKNNPAQQIRVRLYVSDNLVEQPTRVVIEEGTGDWCGYCPYGHDILKQMKQDLGEKVIMLSYHGGSGSEPMQIAAGTEIVDRLGLPGWPSASIQRHTWPGEDVPMINRGLWDSRTRQYLNENPVGAATIEVSNYNYDKATRRVTATVTVHVNTPVLMRENTSINLTAAVTQDSISYPQTFYPQSGGTTKLDPYINPDVVRAIWPSADGQKLTIPASAIQEGVLLPKTILTQDISFTVPAGSSDPRLAFIPEMSNFVVFAHVNEGAELTDILQGYEQPLAEAEAPSLALATDKNEQSVKTETEAVFTTTVTNLTNAPIKVNIARTQHDLPESSWSAYFCINGNCLLPTQHLDSVTITPGGTAKMELHVMTGPQAGLTGEQSLRFTGGNVDQTIKYTTHSIQGTNSVGTSAVAGNGLRLDQNMPNPASGVTRFDYYLPTAGTTTIEVFTVTGQKVLNVVDGRREAGNHSATIDAASLPNGVYTIVLNSNGTRLTRTMTVVH